jgi:hypothetical protein
MKETPWRRITVTSSLNEISTDQLGNRAGGESGAQCTYIPKVPQCLSPRWNWDPPPPLPQVSVPPPPGTKVRGWGVPIRTTGEKA